MSDSACFSPPLSGISTIDGNNCDHEQHQEQLSDEVSLKSLHNTMERILLLKEERKQTKQWETDRQRRATQRRHLIDAGSALAIVAALVGGGVLEVLLSPAWAQISANEAIGACHDSGNCEFWRTLFLITASTAFCLDILALLLTVGAIMGVSKLLSLAIFIFVFALDFIALSLVATSWLAYEKVGAITASCLMGFLAVGSMIVCMPLFFMAWYVFVGKEMKLKLPKYKSDKIQKSGFSAKKVDDLKLSDDEEKEEILSGTSLIHHLSYKHAWYRFIHHSLFEITLASGEDVEKEADDGTTPLMVAAASNNVRIVKALLEEGADPNRKNNQGWSATMLACQRDLSHKNMVRILIDAGGDVSAVAPLRHELVVVVFAAFCNDIEFLRWVLSKGEEINVSKKRFVSMALNGAARYGHLRIVEELLKDQNIDVNAIDADGFTPLMNATFQGHPEVVGVLIRDREVDVNYKDSDGETALSDAILLGRTEIAQQLIGCRDIDVEIEYSDGNTALARAAHYDRLEIVQALLEHPIADVNAANLMDQTPLMEATNEGNLNIVRELLKNSNIIVNLADAQGNTALMIAAYKGRLEIVRELLNHEYIEVNAGMHNSAHALINAAGMGYLEIVRLLLEKPGVPLNAQSPVSRKTALHVAAERDHLPVVQLLLEKQSIEFLEDNNGKTPLQLAEEKGHSTIAEIIAVRMKPQVFDTRDGLEMV